MGLVVRPNGRPYTGRVLFVVLEKGIVEGDGVIGVVQRDRAIDDGVGADGLFGRRGELWNPYSFAGFCIGRYCRFERGEAIRRCVYAPGQGDAAYTPSASMQYNDTNRSAHRAAVAALV